jgi:6,7-dimethyl-8-ribityllumazine synthase
MTSPDQKTGLSTGHKPALDGSGLRVAVVCGRFNDVITNALLDGCRQGLGAHGVDAGDIEVIWAPGAFELPLVAKHLAAEFDAVVLLGAVVRGDTPHFDFVAGECAAGAARVALDTGTPVVFGVLTTDTVAQAEARSGAGPSNKGYEAAETAIEMATLLRSLPSR